MHISTLLRSLLQLLVHSVYLPPEGSSPLLCVYVLGHKCLSVG
jgi:hypothetical protein